MYQSPNQHLQIVQLNFTETGTYNPMYLRPYETNANPSTVAQIQEATLYGQRINPSALSGVAGSFMRPTADVAAAIDIQNGWHSKRLRFIAEIHYPTMAGGRLIQFVTGWTNHPGVSQGQWGGFAGPPRSGQLDPMMTLHFNESILMQEVQEMTATGLVTMRRIVQAAQILSRENYAQFGNFTMDSGVRTLRPEDLFSTTGARYTFGASNNSMGIQMPVRMQDLRPGFLPQVPLKPTSRRNGSASHYLSRAIDGHTRAMIDSEADAMPGELAHSASGKVAEDSISRDNFLTWLRERNLLNAGGSITWGELCHAAPMADQVAKVFMAHDAQIVEQPQHIVGQTSDWKSTDNETVFANILGQSIPSIMLDCMLTKLSFRATNRLSDPYGMAGNRTNHNVALIWYDSLVTATLDMMASAAIEKIGSTVMPNVSMSGLIDYWVECTFDLFGESYLDVSISGGTTRRYCIASFSDSLIVPVVTPNTMAIDTMASDLDFLLKNLNGNQELYAGATSTVAQVGPYGF